MVSIKPRSACRVRVPSRKMILEVYELREALEAFAVIAAGARLIRSAWPDAGHRGADAGAGAGTEERAGAEGNRADRQFHAEIIGLAGNDLLNTFPGSSACTST